MQTVATIFWERLDVDGRDACRLQRLDDGWSIDGTATFNAAGVPAVLKYTVKCDDAWHAQTALVAGWIGHGDMRLTIARDANSGWTLNGRPQPLVAGCIDIDLSFTPATNLLALRRLALTKGQEGQSSAAFLDTIRNDLSRLDQTYRRISRTRYEYHAPRFEFEAVLSASKDGFVTDYPGLWRRVQ